MCEYRVGDVCQNPIVKFGGIGMCPGLGKGKAQLLVFGPSRWCLICTAQQPLHWANQVGKLIPLLLIF